MSLYKLFLTTNLMTPYDSVPLVGQYWSHLILDLSSSLVNITIVEDRCSQTIRQKSATVSGKGPYKKVIYLAKIIETQNTHIIIEPIFSL